MSTKTFAVVVSVGRKYVNASAVNVVGECGVTDVTHQTEADNSVSAAINARRANDQIMSFLIDNVEHIKLADEIQYQGGSIVDRGTTSYFTYIYNLYD